MKTNAKANDCKPWTGCTAGVSKLTRQTMRRSLVQKYGYAEGLKLYRQRRGLPEFCDMGSVPIHAMPQITAQQFEGL